MTVRRVGWSLPARWRGVSVIAGLVLIAGCAAPIAGSAGPIAGSAGPVVSAVPSASTPPATSPVAPASGSDESTSVPVPGTVPADPSGTASAPVTSSGGAPGSSTPGGAISGVGVDPHAFGARMAAANNGVRSLVGSISVVAGPVAEDGTFSETVAGGKVTAIDMSLFVKSDGRDVGIKLLIVNGKLYVGGSAILTQLGAGDKKWALASSTSSNAALKSIAAQLSSFLNTASANQYALYGQAAKSIVDEGPVQLGTVGAHKYQVTVDTAKLIPLTSGLSRTSIQAIVDAGVTSIPTTIWLDGSDRVVQVTTTVKLSGVTSSTVFKVGAYNTAVVIDAPAAVDVYTG